MTEDYELSDSKIDDNLNFHPEVRLPLTIRKLTAIKNDQYFPAFAESSFYGDDKFYCIEFYKPISQISKLI